MMTDKFHTVSMLLSEIYNLRWTADCHKKQCNESCNVSLFMMKNTAIRMRNQLTDEIEQEVATKLINE